MSALDGLAELERLRDVYDAAVAADPRVDAFCTRSDWILSHHLAFQPERPVVASREGGSWAVLAQSHHERLGEYLEPLECMWGFASPLVGPHAVSLLYRLLRDRPAVLLGLPRARSLVQALIVHFEATHELRHLGEVVRFVASLEGGLDGWLARRTRGFRQNLRNARRRVERAGIGFERLAPTPARTRTCYARALAIEARSWKGATGNGADSPGMRAFYGHMLPRLAARGELRCIFARDAEGDVGYLYGGLADGAFRGLQFSFDERVRHTSLGNALQLEMLEWLCESGAASYDLGTHSAYKQHWAEPGLTTFGVGLIPRR